MSLKHKEFLYKNYVLRYTERAKKSEEKEESEEEVLLLIHGIPTFSYTWHKIEEELSESFRVIAWDLKGFGFSDKPLDREYSAGDQVDILLAFISKRNFSSLNLMGHSYGAVLALLLYQKLKTLGLPSPKLIFLNPLFFLSKPFFSFWLARRPFLSKVFFNRFTLAWVPRLPFFGHLFLRGAYFDVKIVVGEPLMNYVRFLKTKPAIQAVFQSSKSIDFRELQQFKEELKTVRSPVCIIWGKEDRVIPLPKEEERVLYAPSVKWNILSNCAHNPQEEKPDKVLRICLEFLRL